MRRWCVGIKREPALNGGFRWGFRWGFRPPHDGVLLVALGVTGVIKKIWFLSFLFLYFLFMLLHCS